MILATLELLLPESLKSVLTENLDLFNVSPVFIHLHNLFLNLLALRLCTKLPPEILAISIECQPSLCYVRGKPKAVFCL